jgi:glycosyltransferase involved in cell wall biosynthesis
MKILWIKSDLLHPTTKGGHIRTLEMLRRIHQRHEVHYAGFENDAEGEGVRRSSEYCSRLYRLPHVAPERTSAAFAGQLMKGLVSPLPVAVFRYASEPMARLLRDLVERERFDSIVCDFITPAINFPSLSSAVIFQHNVETMIWRRHAENARNLAERLYLRMQAERMFDFERRACRAARHVIAVSREDARLMQDMFGIEDVSSIPTGVDVDKFTPATETPRAGLVFVGSMDWLPNIDGMRFFCEEVLPLIRRKRPDCALAIVGREPSRNIRVLAERDALIEVTGTVPDVRPYLWKAAVSIVPLRIGGGTRMKIYEAMAARVPVVSTTVGAEGLDIHPPADISIADTASDFADRCLELLDNASARVSQSEAAWNLVARNFGWDSIARRFESILEMHCETYLETRRSEDILT